MQSNNPANKGSHPLKIPNLNFVCECVYMFGLDSSATWGSRPFKIQYLNSRGGDVNRMLPISHTCFFSIELPAYTTLDAMTDRVSFAMVRITLTKALSP